MDIITDIHALHFAGNILYTDITMDNNDLLNNIGDLIDIKLGPLKDDIANVKHHVAGIKQDVADVKQIQGQMNTALEAVAEGQRDLRTSIQDLRVDVQNQNAKIDKVLKGHEKRISVLEEETGLPHPDKN